MYAYQLCEHAGITNRQRYYWTQKGILQHPVLMNGKVSRWYPKREAFIAALVNYMIKNTRLTVQRTPEFLNRLISLCVTEKTLYNSILIAIWSRSMRNQNYELIVCSRPLTKENKLGNGCADITIVDLSQFYPKGEPIVNQGQSANHSVNRT